MGSGKHVTASRVTFSLFMAIMLMLSMMPIASTQEATPEAPGTSVETELPVNEPEDATQDDPSDGASQSVVPVDVPEEPAGQELDAQPLATMEIGLDSTEPVRCEPGYWMFVLKPKPNPQIGAITVTFTNGNVETIPSTTSGSGQASFRTATNRDSTVASAVAVVPDTFAPTSFVIQSGPCNEEPVAGEYDVTIVANTRDGGSAEGAEVTVTTSDGAALRSGTIGNDGNFLVSGLRDGAYTVSVDGWPAGYNRVSTSFTVSNQDRSVDVDLRPLTAGTIEIEAGESNMAGGARIQGARVTIADQDGTVVGEGDTDERGKFRSDVLPPSVYTVTIDGRGVGYTSVTRTVSNETGNSLTGVVLERLPEEAAVTITAVTWDGGSAEGARVSVKGPGSVEILSGTLDANNQFDAGILPNGKYSVTVNAYDELNLPYMYGFVSSFTVAGQPVNVDVPLNQFPTRGSLTAYVRDAETGQNIVGAEVVVTDPDGNEWSGVTRSTGSVRITRITQGPELTIRINVEGYEPFTATHTFSPTAGSQSAQKVFELQPITQEITIVATTSDGGSAEGALVTIDDGQPESAASAVAPMAIVADGTLDATNSFTTAPLGVGTYTVTVDGTAQGYGIGTATFTVPTETEGPVAVELTLVAASVTINVSSADANLADTLPDGASWTMTSVENPELSLGGTFAADNLALPASIAVEDLVPVGSYIVQFNAGPDFEPYVATVAVTAESAEQSVDVLLVPVVEEPTIGWAAIIKLHCSTVDEVTFVNILDLDENMAGGITENCVSGPAAFTFYLVGDGTDEPTRLVLDQEGAGTVELEEGTYEMVEEGTLARTTVNVVADDVTMLVVFNPVDEVPVEPTPTPAVTPSPTSPVDDEDADDAEQDPATPIVTQLPSTGSGTTDSTGVITLAAAAAAALAGAGTLRKRR